MKIIRTVFLAFMTLIAGVATAAYPDKPIKVLIPFPAGQTTDILGRALANELTKLLNQPIFVENRGGAGGIIGIEAAKRAPNDGYTILIASSGPLSINQNLYKDIPYGTLDDFEPVATILEVPQFLVVRQDFPATTLPQLIELVQKNPGKYNYGSGGVGLTNHLTMEMLKLKTGMNVKHVPYRGATAALTGLLSGDTDMMFESGPAIIQLVDSDKLRVLAIGSQTKSEKFPGAKSVHALGVTGFEATTWMAMLVPKGTPPDVINTLNKATNSVLNLPEIKKQFASVGAVVRTASAQETREFIAQELGRWKETIDKGNITAE
jgi:tripartite-type tricarboxylate transporter receptor subunit TctC